MADTDNDVRIEKIAAWLFVVALAVVCLIYFASFLQPLVLALIVWYFIYATKGYGRKLRIRGKALPEWLLTTFAFVLITLITYGVIEIVTFNLQAIIDRFPAYVANSRDLFEHIQTISGFEGIQSRIIERIEEFDFRPLLKGLLNGLSGFAGNIFMIVVYVGFLVAEQRIFRKKLSIIISHSEQASDFFAILQQVNEAVRTYVIVKSQMCLLTGVLSYFILLLFHVDFPVLWAFLIFLLNYIPYIGSLVATLLPAAFAIFQFHSFAMFAWVFLAIESVQIVVGNVIEPRVMGRTLNLSPLGVLVALTFWGIIWGILGMIISVPITSILVIIASHVPSLRFIAIWLSETGELNDQ
jgi:AI-2 transport protein TqsA